MVEIPGGMSFTPSFMKIDQKLYRGVLS